MSPALAGRFFTTEPPVQFSSVAQSRLTLCDPMDCSKAGFPVHHQLLELAQTHVHRVELVMPSNRLTLCHPLLLLSSIFPASGSFPIIWLFASGGQSIGASASASVLPVNSQDWFPLGLIGLISLLSKGFWRVFFKASIFRHSAFFMVQLTSIHDYIALSRRTFVGKVMSLLLICCLGLSWLFFQGASVF